MEKTLGGDRLGSGNKQKVYLHNYERSTHNLSKLWRSTMAPGTLVPFMKLLALPGDTFDINLDTNVLTSPTIGPLFGTYKVQLDVFQVPLRLYQAQLHMNALGIGLDMKKVQLPLIELKGPALEPGEKIDNQQMNPSCIFSYLGIRGLGHGSLGNVAVRRWFNAAPYLAIWDIYKQYYSNKMEAIGAVIHKEGDQGTANMTSCVIKTGLQSYSIPDVTSDTQDVPIGYGSTCYITLDDEVSGFDPFKLVFHCVDDMGNPFITHGSAIFSNWAVVGESIIGSVPEAMTSIYHIDYATLEPADVTDENTQPRVVTFPLENIDTMRMNILQAPTTTPFMINEESLTPYSLPLTNLLVEGTRIYSQKYSQEGLPVKTYNSDLFNNWVMTDFIDGENGIAAVTAVDTSAGSFTIDELMLSRKIYDMLMRIAVSGGTYDDWLDAVYTHDRTRSAENPIYIGGLQKTLVFQEVINNSGTTDQPLGTLAGRGKLLDNRRGGHIIAKVDEPSYLIGIVSITPNIDYSQGNEWDVNLKTLDDLHKPQLDQIGFQDLITDQMAWWDTTIADGGGGPVPTFRSAGKQPAWINYMTAVNTVHGNFADLKQQGFMILNRDYDIQWTSASDCTIRDLTTYIDPSKFNYIFADTRRDAQNFWVQISQDITARRKMSAKVMPNL